MRARCPRGGWLDMVKSGSSRANASAAVFGRKRLTHARASSPFATHIGPRQHHHQQQEQQQHQLALAVPQVSLFASLATLAAAAATASPTTATAAARSSSTSHHHSHHQSYHPYHKPSASGHNNNSSSDEIEEDERVDYKAEFNFSKPQPQIKPQQHRPQFHPQHRHRLITVTRHHSYTRSMPRRKETKKIQIDVPSSEASAGIVGDPHQVFKCNGSPIISPRSIRNSLAETDFDLDGNPRPQKIANTQPTFNGTTAVRTTSSSSSSESSGDATSDSSNSSQTLVVIGPVVPSQDVASPVTSSNGMKSSRRRNLRQQQQSQQSQQPQEDGDGDANDENDGRPQTEVDLLALKVEEQTLSGLSGVQLWVHRLLYTHHQTLHVLGIERGNFPNTKLSLKQIEIMLSPVISLANMMVPDHFGIHVPTPQVAQTMNDVHYWKLWESDTIDIGYVLVCGDAVGGRKRVKLTD